MFQSYRFIATSKRARAKTVCITSQVKGCLCVFTDCIYLSTAEIHCPTAHLVDISKFNATKTHLSETSLPLPNESLYLPIIKSATTNTITIQTSDLFRVHTSRWYTQLLITIGAKHGQNNIYYMCWWTAKNSRNNAMTITCAGASIHSTQRDCMESHR